MRLPLETETDGDVAEWLRQGPAKPCIWVRFPASPPLGAVIAQDVGARLRTFIAHQQSITTEVVVAVVELFSRRVAVIASPEYFMFWAKFHLQSLVKDVQGAIP